MPCYSSARVAAAAPGWPAEAREHATQLVANHLWKTALTLVRSRHVCHKAPHADHDGAECCLCRQDDYLDVGSLHHRLQTAGQPVCGLILKHTKENDCQSPVLPRKLEYTASNSGQSCTLLPCLPYLTKSDVTRTSFVAPCWSCRCHTAMIICNSPVSEAQTLHVWMPIPLSSMQAMPQTIIPQLSCITAMANNRATAALSILALPIHSRHNRH